MKKIYVAFLVFGCIISQAGAYQGSDFEKKVIANFKEATLGFSENNLEKIQKNIRNIQKKTNNTRIRNLLSELQNSVEETKSIKKVYSEYNFPVDFDEARNIQAFAENIFVAKIIKNKGKVKNTTEMVGHIQYEDIFPETKFQAEVLYNIKGKQKGKIDLIFQGLIDTEKNKLFLPENEKFLAEGGVYLLLTNGKRNMVIAHDNASHLLYFDFFRSHSAGKNESIIESPKIKEFRAAYKEGIKEGIVSGEEENSYKSLTKEEKELYENPQSGYNY